MSVELSHEHEERKFLIHGREIPERTFNNKYRVATPDDIRVVVDQGNWEKHIVYKKTDPDVLDCHYLADILMPRFTFGLLGEEPFFSGYRSGSHALVRARINFTGGLYLFEWQTEGWQSPVGKNIPVSLYILQ